MTARHPLAIVALLLCVLLVACVPETDIDRAAGEQAGDESGDLTPIPESDLPEIPDPEFRVMNVTVQRGGGLTVAEVSIGARSGSSLELADIARVEWSDGEVVDALPLETEGLVVESRRSDPDEALEPVRVVLEDVTYALGTDEAAEIRDGEIETQWGTFPVLDIYSTNRPPGWKLEFQAIGQRWISEAVAYEGRRARDADGADLTFTEEFRPVMAALQFDHQVQDLEEAMPMQAEVDVRVAVPEVALDLS